MAALTTQPAQVRGLQLAFTAAGAGGDTVPIGSSLLVRNGSGASINVTLDIPGNTKFGEPNPDVVIPVPAGQTVLIGALPNDLANPSDGLAHVTYSSVTTVTVAAISAF